MSADLVRAWDNWWLRNDADQRKAWQRWLKMHGITPDLVRNADAVLIRRPEQRQIAYGTYAGAELTDRNALRFDTYVDEDGWHEPVRATRLFQMEAAPLPFPKGC